jgi:hypothetical protein
VGSHTQCGTCGHLVVDGGCQCPQGVATVRPYMDGADYFGPIYHIDAQLTALQSLLDERDRQAVGQALEERMRTVDVDYEVESPYEPATVYCDSLERARRVASEFGGSTIIRVTREVVE